MEFNWANQLDLSQLQLMSPFPVFYCLIATLQTHFIYLLSFSLLVYPANTQMQHFNFHPCALEVEL